MMNVGRKRPLGLIMGLSFAGEAVVVAVEAMDVAAALLDAVVEAGLGLAGTAEAATVVTITGALAYRWWWGCGLG
jgi:hypothetical protein